MFVVFIALLNGPLPAVAELVSLALLQFLQSIFFEEKRGSEIGVVGLCGRDIDYGCIFLNSSFGANGEESTYELIQLFCFDILLLHNHRVFFCPNFDISYGILFEEELELSPVVIPAGCVLGVLEGVHWDLARFISRYYLGYQETVAHVLAVVLDGVGEIEPLHPFQDLAGERAFGS